MKGTNMAGDRGGDSLKSSSKLRITSKAGKVKDFVSRGEDPNDLFGFRLRNSSSASFNLSRLQANVNIELYALETPRRKALKQIGGQEFSALNRRQINRHLKKVAQSKRGGRRQEAIAIDLEPGFYYVRVFTGQQQGSRYRLRYQFDPIPEVLPTNPDFPPNNSPDTGVPGDGSGSDTPGTDNGTNNPGTGSPGTDTPGNPTPSPDTEVPTMPDEPDPALGVPLYSGTGLPITEGWLAPQQFPASEAAVDEYLSDPVFSNSLISGIVNSFVQDAKNDRQIAPALAETPGPDGVTVDTRFFNDDPNRGYFGYSNYQPVFPDPDSLNLFALASSPDPYAALAQQVTIEKVNSNFPVLNATAGYSLEFDLTLNTESSAANRAGFSLTVIGDNGLGVELGFKADRIFAQAADLTNASEAENVATNSLGTKVRYRLAVDGSGYRLFADNSQILNGTLRDYIFDPAQSDPALPVNPYETENLIFFGDNTDQGFANFTLGRVSLFT
ncbi:MAG: hypothetical protein VKK04_08060 [Synechococcales bacterium]|nr:hypothetical protein [Synechococcales bacterium]